MEKPDWWEAPLAPTAALGAPPDGCRRDLVGVCAAAGGEELRPRYELRTAVRPSAEFEALPTLQAVGAG